MSGKSGISAAGRMPAAQSDALRFHLQEAFQRGMQLSAERHFEYAHELFAQCVMHDAGNIAFVEAMVQNLRVKTPHVAKSMLILRRGGSRELKKGLQNREWTVVFREGIRLLKIDPWDVTTLRAMAEACATLHHNEVELVYLKQALDAEPKNIEVNRHCARSLQRMGQFDQAIACWHRIETLKGKDAEAARMVCELAEEKLKYPGGRPPMAQRAAEGPVTSIAAEKLATHETPQVTFSPRQRLGRAIADDPYDVSNYLKLADLMYEAEQFAEAEAVLNRGITTIGEQATLVDRLQRVRAQRIDWEMELAEAQRQRRERLERKPIHIPWLELVLGMAAIALLFQFFPAMAAATWRLIDFRNWSRLTWFVANVVVLLFLCGIRFGSELFRSNKKGELTRRGTSNR